MILQVDIGRDFNDHTFMPRGDYVGPAPRKYGFALHTLELRRKARHTPRGSTSPWVWTQSLTLTWNWRLIFDVRWEQEIDD